MKTKGKTKECTVQQIVINIECGVFFKSLLLLLMLPTAAETLTSDDHRHKRIKQNLIIITI